jgi:hypothetical protein
MKREQWGYFVWLLPRRLILKTGTYDLTRVFFGS